MSLSGLANGLENLSEDQDALVGIAQHWQIFVIIGLVATGVLLFKVGRKGLVATASATETGLGARLAEIDLENYDLDGTRQDEPAPSVNMDDFFSNTERRDALTRETRAPEPEPVLFDVPSLDVLPKPSPNEPQFSDAAKERVTTIVMRADRRSRGNPAYVMTEEEALATAAWDATLSCESLCTFAEIDPDVVRFGSFAKVARILGAADLEAIINLQIKLLETTAAPEWRERKQHDERWYPVKQTGQELSTLFSTANRSDEGCGRLIALVDAYLAE